MNRAALLNHEQITQAVSQMPRLFFSGRVSRVVGLMVEGTLPHMPVGGMCRIHRQRHRDVVLAEVVGLKGELVMLMPVGSTHGIQVGDRIEPLRTEAAVSVSESMLGRILDGSGDPMDDGPSLTAQADYGLYRAAVSPVTRQMVSKPLGLGVRVMDGLMSCGVGQRLAIMAGSGVGKSTLLGMIARHTQADVNVIALVGERGREVREFLETDLGADGLQRSVVVIATSDSPALLRMRAAFVATTIAEFFRDRGAQVLLMMDSLTRYAMATREIGLSLGEPPTVKGYTPSLFSTLPRLLERAGTCEGTGSITGLYTILTEGDDIQDPIADAVRAIVDGHVVLSRKMTNMGFYPPVNVLDSLSRVMRAVVSPQHFQAASVVRAALSLYEEMEDYIKMGVYVPGKNPALDKVIAKRDRIEAFLRQDVADVTSHSETVARLTKLAMELQ